MFLLICLIAICAVGLVVVILLWWEHGHLCFPSANTLTLSNTLSLNTPDPEDTTPQLPTYEQAMTEQARYPPPADCWKADANRPWNGQGDWSGPGDPAPMETTTTTDNLAVTSIPLGARPCPTNYQTRRPDQQAPPPAGAKAVTTCRIRAN